MGARNTLDIEKGAPISMSAFPNHGEDFGGKNTKPKPPKTSFTSCVFHRWDKMETDEDRIQTAGAGELASNVCSTLYRGPTLPRPVAFAPAEEIPSRGNRIYTVGKVEVKHPLGV